MFNFVAFEMVVITALLMQPTVTLMKRFGNKELLVLACCFNAMRERKQ